MRYFGLSVLVRWECIGSDTGAEEANLLVELLFEETKGVKKRVYKCREAGLMWI